MNIVGAIVAGLVGTAVMTVIMMMAPRMGMPEMDIVGLLGSMFSKESNRTLGLVMHFVIGIVFALIYAWLWSVGIGSVSIVSGIIFGIVHWLVVGLVMGAMPMMHTGIQAGAVEAPGLYMTDKGGMMGFMGGLVGHILFGLIVALIYGFFV